VRDSFSPGGGHGKETVATTAFCIEAHWSRRPWNCAHRKVVVYHFPLRPLLRNPGKDRTFSQPLANAEKDGYTGVSDDWTERLRIGPKASENPGVGGSIPPLSTGCNFGWIMGYGYRPAVGRACLVLEKVVFYLFAGW